MHRVTDALVGMPGRARRRVTAGMADRTAEHGQRVTTLELFFDLVLVSAFTQVTSFLTRDPTWHGVFRGLLVLAAIWWAWTGYAWLTSGRGLRAGEVSSEGCSSSARSGGPGRGTPG